MHCFNNTPICVSTIFKHWKVSCLLNHVNPLIEEKFVKSWIIGTLSHWYAIESAQQELSNEYQCGRTWSKHFFGAWGHERVNPCENPSYQSELTNITNFFPTLSCSSLIRSPSFSVCICLTDGNLVLIPLRVMRIAIDGLVLLLSDEVSEVTLLDAILLLVYIVVNLEKDS